MKNARIMAYAVGMTVALAALFGGHAIAGEDAATAHQVTGERLETVTATVEEIDAKTRTVTLKGPQGGVFDVAVGEEVKNFPQIEVGDKVRVEYYEALALRLKKGGAGVRGDTEEFARFSAQPGEKPAGSAARTVTIAADVMNVNPEEKTVTLKGRMRTVEVSVEDPEVLARLKVGDQVQATYTEALAVSVEPAPTQ